MEDRPGTGRFSHPAFGLALMAPPLLAAIRGGPLFYDDAFITFRYAEHISQGLGFVYNSEPVLGTTAPLYALMLAAARLAGAPMEVAALAIGVFFAALCPLLAWRILAARGLAFAGFMGGLFLSLFPRWWLAGVSGMETTLAAALALGVGTSLIGRRPALAGVLSSLLILTRPDAGTLPAMIFVYYAVADRKSLGRFTAGGAPLMVCWLVFSLWRFGSPAPQSLDAKRLIHAYPFHLSLVHYLTWFTAVKAPPGMAAFSLAWALGVVVAARRASSSLLLVLWPPVFILGLALTMVGPFPWYKYPALPAFMLGAGLGVAGIVAGEVVSGKLDFRRRVLLASAVVGVLVSLQLVEAYPILSKSEALLSVRRKEAILREMSELIKARSKARGWSAGEVDVYAGEVGVLGWELMDYVIIDSAGINSPEVYEIRRDDFERLSKMRAATWEDKWRGTPDWSRTVIEKYEPEFIGTDAEYLHLASLLKETGFADKYRLVKDWTYQDPETSVRKLVLLEMTREKR